MHSTTRRAECPRHVIGWLLAVALMVSLLLTGCGGGSSQTVISTGFPADNAQHSLPVSGIDTGTSLTLRTPPNGVTTPVSFAAPQPIADAAVPAANVAGGGTATYIPGTAYQFSPSTPTIPPYVTLTISYGASVTADPATLNIYYLDSNNVWQPVQPVPGVGGFSNLPKGQVVTTLTQVQGKGLYAVLSSQPPAHP